MKLAVDDFVVLLENNEEIEFNSVGIIKEIYENTKSYRVLFIGKNIELVIRFNYVRYLDLKKTGKGYDYKICNLCYILKKEGDEFEINQTDAKGVKTTRPTCKKCRESINGKPLKATERKRMLQEKPTLIFTCPICNKCSIPGITANIVIDHDHLTGNARTWICDSCNTGLGRFKDSIELLESAINYLKGFTK